MTRKMIFLSLIVAFLLFSKASNADSTRDITAGFGYGATYNGLGFNVGVKGSADMHYVSFGCVGITRSEQFNNSDNANTGLENCGFAIGSLWDIKGLAIGSLIGSLWEMKKTCCFGINYGRTFNKRSDTGARVSENHLRFSYIYFFRGLAKGGLNLGLSPVLTFGDGMNSRQTLLINFGVQF